jgi:hypothetical protein
MAPAKWSISPARWGSTENRVVYLGWQKSDDGETRPSYEISLPASTAINDEDVLVFSLAGTREDPCPDQDCRKARSEDYHPPETFNLTVEVSDRDGQIARIPLNSYAVLHLPLETRLAKSPFKIVIPESEIILQHYEFPLAGFLADNPAFSPSKLSTLRLVFDRTPEGVVVLDHIGLRQE